MALSAPWRRGGSKRIPAADLGSAPSGLRNGMLPTRAALIEERYADLSISLPQAGTSAEAPAGEAQAHEKDLQCSPSAAESRSGKAVSASSVVRRGSQPGFGVLRNPHTPVSRRRAPP